MALIGQFLKPCYPFLHDLLGALRRSAMFAAAVKKHKLIHFLFLLGEVEFHAVDVWRTLFRTFRCSFWRRFLLHMAGLFFSQRSAGFRTDFTAPCRLPLPSGASWLSGSSFCRPSLIYNSQPVLHNLQHSTPGTSPAWVMVTLVAAPCEDASKTTLLPFHSFLSSIKYKLQSVTHPAILCAGTI